MPTSQSDLEKVKSLRAQAAAANRESGKLTSGATTFRDRVMERVNKASAERGLSKLQQGVSETTGQIYSAPADIRARTADVNPLAVDAITQRQLGQTLSTLATEAQIGSQRTQKYEDVLGAGTNQLLAAAEQKKAEAQSADMEAENLMDMIRLRMQEEQARADLAYKQAQTAALNRENTGEFDLESMTPEVLAEMVATGQLSSAEANFIQKARGLPSGERQQEISSFKERLGNLKGKLDGVKGRDVLDYPAKGLLPDLIGESDSVTDFIIARNLMQVELARLFEKGVLTDADREYYSLQMPTDSDIFSNLNFAKDKLDALIDYFDDMSAADTNTSRPSLDEIYK